MYVCACLEGFNFKAGLRCAFCKVPSPSLEAVQKQLSYKTSLTFSVLYSVIPCTNNQTNMKIEEDE